MFVLFSSYLFPIFLAFIAWQNYKMLMQTDAHRGW